MWHSQLLLYFMRTALYVFKKNIDMVIVKSNVVMVMIHVHCMSFRMVLILMLCAVLQWTWSGVSGVSALDQYVDWSVCNSRRHARGCFPRPIFYTVHAGNLHISHLTDIHLWNFQEDICRTFRFVGFYCAVLCYCGICCGLCLSIHHKPLMHLSLNTLS